MAEERYVRRARPTKRPQSRLGSVRSLLAARALIVLAEVAQRLPPALLQRLGHLVGGVMYRVRPARRRLVRANLERIVGFLAAREMGGERVAAAARDGRALDRLVRDAFGHYIRGYLELAALPAYARSDRLARVKPDDPQLLDRAFAPGSTVICGLHFGALEIPGLWATHFLGRRITAPMETIDDPRLQSYFEGTRKRTGLNVIPMERAATELRAALARGEAVALVADRPVGGAGAQVELFGAPARLPLGPAALALESGAPVWMIATRRSGWTDYRSRIEKIEMPTTGIPRAQLRSFLHNQAAAFERAVADAPDQWWTTFFQIWPDIPA
ncbi:MAG TPA: lysophospholipid acyltransferase family protein [Candidatus Limnocylindrales bacterium]|nr:lysophospholipid acyltransferase family protein [Candidatus Limnocylindrales bacterium]